MPSHSHGTPADFRRIPSALAAGLIATASIWGSSVVTSAEAVAKTPGKTYCFVGKCHRVMTLDETRRAVGRPQTVVASHYGAAGQDRFNPSNLTSSGEWYRPGAPDNAASPRLPNGTIILVRNPATRQSAVLRINNAGPYWGNRTLDVSRGAAQRLGFASKGVASLQMRILQAPSTTEAGYRKGRRYAAVPGPIGTHASLDEAAAAAGRAMGRTTVPSSMVATATRPTPAVRSVAKAATPVVAAAQTAASTTEPAASVPSTAVPAVVASKALTGGSVLQAAPRQPRAARPQTAAANRAPECQGWVGTCTVTVSSGARTRVASTSSKRQ